MGKQHGLSVVEGIRLWTLILKRAAHEPSRLCLVHEDTVIAYDSLIDHGYLCDVGGVAGCDPCVRMVRTTSKGMGLLRRCQ